MTTDMTSGSAYRHLWRYALPLMLGNWFQLCYNAADSVIAGRFIGAHALAAEGAAGPVMNLVILAISGVTVGAGVLMELCYGLFIGGATALLRTPVVSLFVTGPSAQAVVELGARYLGAMAVFYLLPAFTNGFQGYFRGMGRLGVTLLGTLIQTSLRVVFTMLLAPRPGILGIAFACAGGWCVMLLVEVPLYLLRMQGREDAA